MVNASWGRSGNKHTTHVVCAFYFTDRDLRPCLPIGLFFADLYDVLDRLDTFVEPLFIVGDLNVHLEQTNYASVSQLIDLLADYGLAYHVPAQTHDLGGLLDVVHRAATVRRCYPASEMTYIVSSGALNSTLVGGVAQWLGCRSVAGGLSLICA